MLYVNILSYLIIITILSRKVCYYSHFIDERTKSHSPKKLVESQSCDLDQVMVLQFRVP